MQNSFVLGVFVPRFTPSLILFAFIILICTAWWGDSVIFVGDHFGADVSMVTLGDWGDAFAPLNSIFSGLAFLGVAATVYLQRKNNRQLEKSEGKREFERFFFQIFPLVRELRSELAFQETKRSSSRAFGPNRLRTGSSAIKAAYNEILNLLYEQGIEKSNSITRERLARVYNVIVNRKNEAEFSPYFRAVYTILKRIDKCDYLSDFEKIEYSRLVRSQMTGHEAALLGLNGLSENSKDLDKYVTKYRMLKYSKSGAIRNALEQAYPLETFEGR